MLSLQNICLNILERNHIIPEDLPYQLPPRYYHRRPILKIFKSGLCMGPHCKMQEEQFDDFVSKINDTSYICHHIVAVNITIEYTSGRYKLITKKFINHMNSCLDKFCEEGEINVDEIVSYHDNIKENIEIVNLKDKGYRYLIQDEDPLTKTTLNVLYNDLDCYSNKIQKIVESYINNLPNNFIKV